MWVGQEGETQSRRSLEGWISWEERLGLGLWRVSMCLYCWEGTYCRWSGLYPEPFTVVQRLFLFNPFQGSVSTLYLLEDKVKPKKWLSNGGMPMKSGTGQIVFLSLKTQFTEVWLTWKIIHVECIHRDEFGDTYPPAKLSPPSRSSTYPSPPKVYSCGGFSCWDPITFHGDCWRNPLLGDPARCLRRGRRGSGPVKSFPTVSSLHQFEAVCCPLVAFSDFKLSAWTVPQPGWKSRLQARLTSLRFKLQEVGSHGVRGFNQWMLAWYFTPAMADLNSFKASSLSLSPVISPQFPIHSAKAQPIS